MFRTLLISALFLASLSGYAHAGFVKTDWKTSGDASAVLDTSTGIEWLNLLHTDKKSINTIVSQLDTLYVGWRLPTNAEVEVFLTNVWGGINMQVDQIEARSGPYQTGAIQWANLMSDGVKNLALNGGFYYDEDGIVRIAGSYNNDNGAYTWTYGAEFSPVFSADAVQANWRRNGVFLVSDGGVTISSINNPNLNVNNPNAPVNQASVDVSTPIAFGALGLLFCLGLRRKKSMN